MCLGGLLEVFGDKIHTIPPLCLRHLQHNMLKSPCTIRPWTNLLGHCVLVASSKMCSFLTKGIDSRDEYFFKGFSFLLLHYLIILKILPVTRFKDPKAAIYKGVVYLENVVALIRIWKEQRSITGIRLWLCKVLIKMFRLSKKYSSRDTVPFKLIW